jgi:hypothetical protein
LPVGEQAADVGEGQHGWTRNEKKMVGVPYSIPVAVKQQNRTAAGAVGTRILS